MLAPVLKRDDRIRRRALVEIREKTARIWGLSDETSRVKNDPDLMQSIRDSYEAERKGNVHSLEEAREKLLG